MRSLLLSLAVLPALLALSPPQDQYRADPGSPTVRFKTYRDREYGIQVKQPRGWYVADDRSQGDLRVQFQTFDEDNVLLDGQETYAAIFLGVSDTVGKSLHEITEGFRTDPPPGYEVSQISDDKLGRLKAKRVIATTTVDGVDLALISVWAVRGERTYSLMLSVPVEDVLAMRSVFEKIRKTFVARSS